ncbi:MAG: hypothetical protein ABJN65_00935 [Parasphingorhabdus sp.]
MKNIQIIDDAINAAYDIYEISDELFSLLFPADSQNIEFIEDFFERVGDTKAQSLQTQLWERKIPKKDVNGIHGTLFYGLLEKKKYYPEKSEPVIDWKLVN